MMITSNNAIKTINPDQLRFYNEQGYVHLSSCIAPEALELARTILQRWANYTIDGWVQAGLIDDIRSGLSLENQFYEVWKAAGRPGYIRSPRRDLVSREMFDFLRHPSLLDIAQDLLQTTEISVHGIFNARPKLPDQFWTDTPWHQDAQYYRDAENSHVVSIWIPLQRVTEENSCLQVAAGLQRGKLHAPEMDKTGFIGLPGEEQDKLAGISVPMEIGDALCFHQKTPHRALSNRSNAVRWSMDVRYEATPQATESGKRQGFIAHSEEDPFSETTFEQWLEKWHDVPLGSY